MVVVVVVVAVMAVNCCCCCCVISCVTTLSDPLAQWVDTWLTLELTSSSYQLNDDITWETMNLSWIECKSLERTISMAFNQAFCVLLLRFLPDSQDLAL